MKPGSHHTDTKPRTEGSIASCSPSNGRGEGVLTFELVCSCAKHVVLIKAHRLQGRPFSAYKFPVVILMALAAAYTKRKGSEEMVSLLHEKCSRE